MIVNTQVVKKSDSDVFEYGIPIKLGKVHLFDPTPINVLLTIEDNSEDSNDTDNVEN